MTVTTSLFYVFVTSLLLMLPCVPPELCKWYVGLYAIILLALMTICRVTILIKDCWALYGLLLANCLACFFHASDFDTLINLSARLIAIIALCALARAIILLEGSSALLARMHRYFWWCAAAMLVLSTVLTLAGSKAVPTFFFWQAFTSDKRLLVMTTESSGHSDILWLSMVLYFLLMSSNSGKQITFFRVAAFVPITLVLVASKARVGLLYFLIVAVAVLAYKQRTFGTRLMLALTPVILSAIFYAGIFMPGVTQDISEQAAHLEELIPGLRVQGSKTNIYTGRNVLNATLLAASIQSPFTGLGHSSPYLKLGVGENGQFATGTRVAATSESGLRMPVEYGWPYTFLTLAFVTVPMFRAVRGYYRDNVMVIGVIATILVCVVTEGGFENFYSISAIYLFLIACFYFTPPVANYAKSA